MNLKDYFKKGKFYVWKETFAIVKSRKYLPNVFAVIRDKNEITVIINQSKIKNNKNIIKIDKNWRIITFDMVLPFGLIGLFARISKILANKRVSIFVISAYSTDHILIKEKDVEKTVKTLESIGFIVKQKI